MIRADGIYDATDNALSQGISVSEAAKRGHHVVTGVEFTDVLFAQV
jgi:hypothetical protein